MDVRPVIRTRTRFLTCSSISKKNPHSSAHRVTPRPRRKIPPPTSSVNATAPRVEAEPPKRHPAGRSSCPRLGLALVTEPGCVYGHVAAHPPGPFPHRAAVSRRAVPFLPPRRLELVGYRSSPPGRPWPPATLCFSSVLGVLKLCFKCFISIF